jgi:hypothetical protein
MSWGRRLNPHRVRSGVVPQAALVGFCAPVVLALMAAAACSSGGDSSPDAEPYDDPSAVVAALNDGGFDCSDAEYFPAEWEREGATEAGVCDHDGAEVHIVMFRSHDPPADILHDVTGRIIAGPNWLVGTSDTTDLYNDIEDAVGGVLVWDSGPTG